MIHRLRRKLHKLVYNTRLYSELRLDSRDPYRRLLRSPRYVPGAVVLDGREFVFADARSFYHSHREIFLDGIYEFAAEGEDPLIIDCGSSYGTSILYFKMLYPESRIIGFEADPFIFEFLRTNISTYQLQDVDIHNRAVWFEETELDFQRENADAGRLTFDAKEDSVCVKSINLSDYLTDEVQLLKVDIEGAEVEVLTRINNPANIQRIFVEYHSFEGQPQRLDELLSFFREHGFRYQIQTQFGTRQPFVGSTLHLGMDMQLNVFASRSSPFQTGNRE